MPNFQPLVVEPDPRGFFATAMFFSVNIYTGGTVSAALLNAMGNPDYLEIEVDLNEKAIRLRATEDETKSPTAGRRIRLDNKTRIKLTKDGIVHKPTVRFMMELNADGWWYSVP